MRLELDHIQYLGDAFFTNSVIVNPQGSGATTTLQVSDSNIMILNDNMTVDVQQTMLRVAGGSLQLGELAGSGTRPIGVDDSGNIVEIAGGGGGALTITDDFAQSYSPTALNIIGRPSTPVKFYFSSPDTLELRIEGGLTGQVLTADSDFGVSWQNPTSPILTHSEIITPIANSPLVITHNWGTTAVQVSVYNTATGELVVPETVSRDSNVVRVTMSVAFEIEVVIIGFIPLI